MSRTIRVITATGESWEARTARMERERDAARAIVAELVKVATDATPHLMAGSCPHFGDDARDEDCPACQVIVRAEKLGGEHG